jgi:hypothetical protein
MPSSRFLCSRRCGNTRSIARSSKVGGRTASHHHAATTTCSLCCYRSYALTPSPTLRCAAISLTDLWCGCATRAARAGLTSSRGDWSPVDLPPSCPHLTLGLVLESIHAPLCNCGSTRLCTCAMFKMPTGDTDSGASAAASTESLVCDYSTADGPAKRPAPGSSGLSVEPSPRPSKARKQDAVSSAGCEASEAPHDKGGLGVICVDLAPTADTPWTSHCGWCDTVIEQGAPRVVKGQFHAAGWYSRNNGETEGYTHGGVLRLYLHPQCAWAAVLTKRDATCSGCATVVKKDTWLFTTRLGTAAQLERRPPPSGTAVQDVTERQPVAVRELCQDICRSLPRPPE